MRGHFRYTGPQPNRNNNNRGNNREEVDDSIVDAQEIINARRRPQLADNSDYFQALSKAFDNIEYPKDFKPTNCDTSGVSTFKYSQCTLVKVKRKI